MRLNLGGGRSKKPGWLNVDRLEVCQPDVLHDLTVAPWPFADNSVERAEADNLVEHIGWSPAGDDLLMVFMNEAHRVIRPGGALWMRVPDAEKWPWGAFRDPTHRRYMVSGSFDYWTEGHPTFKNYGSSYGYRPWNVDVKSYSPGKGRSFLDVTQTPVK